jgi:putative NADPH-quinone reductase
MGMPALVYRWYFMAHSVKALERIVFGFVGIAPVHRTLIGTVQDMTDARRARWLAQMHDLGTRGA